MEAPLISIILPVYNGQSFLREAIESCLNQTYKNIEVIIVNDCSTDDTLKIAKEYSFHDGRIRIITNKKNKKLPASLNIGHRAANGALITWTSDDNIYHKSALQRMIEVLKEKEVDIVYSSYLLINEQGNITGVSKNKDIEYLMFHGIIGACFLYKREVYLRNRGYREDLFLVEDLDFWLRALKHSNFYKIDNPGLYYYRNHIDSLTAKIKTDTEIKKRFLRSLTSLYDSFFSKCKLLNKEILIEYFIKRYKGGAYSTLIPIENDSFFSDLTLATSSLNGFSSKKLNQIIFKDTVEGIMRDKNYQNISTLVTFHKNGKWKFLQLPIDRYLALIRKCLS